MASGSVMNEPPFKSIKYDLEYTDFASNTGKSFSKTNVGFSVPEGYEVFSYNAISSESIYVGIADCDPFQESRLVILRNNGSSSVTSTGILRVIFINTKYKESLGIV